MSATPGDATRYDRFLTARSRSREVSAIRALMPLMAKPGAISLGGGMPNPETFPLSGLSFTMRDPDGEDVKLEVDSMSDMLQYTASTGLPALTAKLGEFQDYFHPAPPATRENRDIFVSTGSQDALTKTLECLLDHGDSILVEDATYAGTLNWLTPYGCNIVSVKTDAGGIIPSDVDRTLSNWDKTSSKPKPRVLYVIPTGSNPAGISLSVERRREVYAVACKHDLLVLEDDPYYFLQFCKPSKFLPSLYSMDVEGRVVRFDSFSKVVSAGLRLGYMTGPKQIVQRVMLHQQVTDLHASGVSQCVVLAMLRHWGIEGFKRHVQKIADFYRERRDDLLGSIETHLPPEMATVDIPEAGMFLWLRLDCVRSTREFVRKLVYEKGLLIMAGHFFSPTNEDLPYVRLSYSLVGAKDLDNAMFVLGEALRQHAREENIMLEDDY